MCYTNIEICVCCCESVKDTVPCQDYNIDSPFRHTKTGRKENNASHIAARFHVCQRAACQWAFRKLSAHDVEVHLRCEFTTWYRYCWDTMQKKTMKELKKWVRHECKESDKETQLEIMRTPSGNLIWGRD